MMNSGKVFQRTIPHRSPVRVAFVFGCSLLLAASVTANNKKALQRAQKALRAGDFERAEQLYREILQEDDRDKEARLGLSKALLKQRRLRESFHEAARIARADPLSARAHALLGSATLASGDFSLALQEFRTALSLDDNEAIAEAGLAMIDFYENRTASAVIKLQRAARIDPSEPDYVFSLGQAAARSEKYKEAADAYERFLAIAPRTDADRRARIRGLIDFLRYLGKQDPLYTLSGAARVDIPFETVDSRPIVSITVNGSKVLRFVIDTGSGMSVVSEDTARILGLKPIARGGLARAVGGGGKFEIVYGYLKSIDVGGQRIENVPVYIRHFFDTQTAVDGYLGVAALSRLVTVIDYGARRMTLMRQRLAEAVPTGQPETKDPGSEGRALLTSGDIPFRTTSSGFMSGEVKIEGVREPLNFIIDTGASVSVLSHHTAEREELIPFIKEDRMQVIGAAGVAADVKVAVLPKIVIGTHAREKINAAILDLDPINETTGFLQSGILGGNFLSQFRVTFDFPGGVVRLEPLDGPRSPNPSETAKARPTEQL